MGTSKLMAKFFCSVGGSVSPSIMRFPHRDTHEVPFVPRKFVTGS